MAAVLERRPKAGTPQAYGSEANPVKDGTKDELKYLLIAPNFFS